MTQKNNTSLTISLKTDKYDLAIKSLESDLSKAVSNGVPVRELITQGASIGQITVTLSMLITKAAIMLSVGGNLKSGQSLEIAEMLISEYPLASLDDFKIMLQRGTMGRYGELYRFDVAVIFGWMGEYMAEWAEEKEKQLAKQKNKKVEFEVPENADEFSPETNAMIQDFINSLSTFTKVPAMTEQEIKENGKERPQKRKATAGVVYSTPDAYLLRQKKIEYGQLYTDLHTGKVKDGAPTFDQWLQS